MMKIISSAIAIRPVLSFIVLGILVLAIPISAILSYQIMAYKVQHNLESAARYLRSHVLSDVQTIARSVPNHAAALNLASVLRSSLNEPAPLPFSKINTMVAPKLFLAFMLHNITQISYLQSNGLFFSYYMDGNQTLSLYSNTTSVDVKGKATNTSYNLYKQSIDKITGEPYGDVSIISNSDTSFKNSVWFQKTIRSSNGYSFVGNVLGSKISASTQSLFLSMASISGGGVVSLGASVKDFVYAIKRVNTFNGTLFLGTSEGNILTHNDNLNASIVINDASVSIELTKDGEFIGKNRHHGIANISCDSSHNLLLADDIEIDGEKYQIYCQPLEIAGIKSASIMLYRKNGFLKQVRRSDNISWVLLALAVLYAFLSTAFFIVLVCKGTRREMVLSATLMKQMEATQQAERRSMNKSIAFASANHDIRGALATIVGLIEFCLTEISPGSNLDNNLSQMKSASLDLLELLNSVLDASRIEAGKMQLHEEVFDVAKVIEEAVNFIYPWGVENGIDIVLDHCDGSVLKSPLVKGDRGKLKQILNNLLSNAVKFTSEGHVVLRAWARKPSSKASLLSPNCNGMWKRISHLVYKNSGQDYNNALHGHNENSLELVIEVDDTGKGIPKEKRDSIFENFVQVKETSLGQDGTGLGLGIVQSLVRLMGGEIRILDKEISERGTCFNFNIFLSKEENMISTTGLNRSPSKIEDSSSSHVILMIQDNERRSVTKNFIRTLGVKVSAIDRWEHVLPTLQKIKRGFHINYSLSSSGKSERLGSYSDYLSRSTSHSSIAARNDGNYASGNEQVDASRSSTPHRKTILARNAIPPFIMIIIDDHVEPISEVCSVVTNFRNNLPCHMRFRIVGLVSPIVTGKNIRIARKRLTVTCDDIFIKPFHGSRLHQVLQLLPEFGGNTSEKSHSKTMEEQVTQLSFRTNKDYSPRTERVVQQGGVSPSTDDFNLLNGKKVLVVEDQFILRKLATAILSRLGAIIEVCENGEEAVKQVSKALKEPDQRPEGTSKFLPYDYILMDCQMPVMDGYEATRRIRMTEQFYDIRIPIIALTANEAIDEPDMRREAGMDFHLSKPLKVDPLLDAIRFVDTINTH